jgi:type I restriction enzyme R subunit
LVTLYGGDITKAQKGFADRLAKELDSRGTVDVLRHGVVDHGSRSSWRTSGRHRGLNPELIERYGKNRLTVTRQLPFEPESTKTLDLCLFVNGVPVATAELKNGLTGPDVGARHRAVPHRPRPEEHPAAPGGRALRGRHRDRRR